ncbi:MAG: hypothetical protein AAFW81_02890 [Pseudomonadota bacterium]
MESVEILGIQFAMMDRMTVFGLQFLLSVLVFALIARWFVGPWLAQKSQTDALSILLLPHAFRHLGLAFFVPGLVGEDMPALFSITAGYGDLLSALLAIISLIALRNRWAIALPLVFVFSMVGVADLLNALRQADVVPHFRSVWYIPTFVVPMLIVTHVLIIRRLFSRGQKA